MLNPSSLDSISQEPGVYLIRDDQQKVLYVGKAKSLRRRVSQYMKPGGDGRALMPYLQKEAHSVETWIARSETEALLLENNLIKKYLPKYNVLLKDDKSYTALVLSDHSWPALEMVRYKDVKSAGSDKKEIFGPYSPWLAKEMMQLVQELTLLRRCSDSELRSRKRPCLLHGMKKCMAPCVGLCSSQAYEEQVQMTKELLKGGSALMEKKLKQKIAEASEQMDFEKASELHTLLQKIEKNASLQSVDLPDAIEADLLYLERTAAQVAFCQLAIRQGRLMDVQIQLLEAVEDDDEALLESLCLQYLETQVPSVWGARALYVSLNAQSLKTIEQVAKDQGFKQLSVKSPLRGVTKEWLEIARKNARHRLSHAQLEKSKLYEQLGMLKIRLELTQLPVWIECFDTSHHRGSEHVAASVAFIEAQAAKSKYRRYKTTSKGNDLQAMAEIIERRFQRAKKEGAWPQLFILDGGQLHLHMAIEIAQKMDVVGVDMLAISKEKGIHTKGLLRERLHRKDKEILDLEPSDPALLWIQKIRDEAHRFAIDYHRQRQSRTLTQSALDDIPGIGPKKRSKLLKIFGSLAALQKASVEDLSKLSFITRQDRDRLKEYLGLKSSSASEDS
jgi:excinuclease ABC subunit C